MLANKVAFITGAASGIGAATARRFAEQGASVVIADVQTEAGQRVAQEITASGGKALFTCCDVTDAAAVEQAITTTIEHFGRLDIVFANAGINGVWAPVEEILPDEWARTLDINLKGTFLTVHFAVPYLKQNGGSIIITSSVNGTRTFSVPGTSAYGASKAGQVAFMKILALELGRHNIRCNAVCPGYIVDTDLEKRTETRNIDAIGIDVYLPKGHPAIDSGKGDAAEVADVCLFLASDLSRHVSGVEIYVDGGASLLR